MAVKSLGRRRLFVSTASIAALFATSAGAASYSGALPFTPDKNNMPTPDAAAGWQYFTADEAAAIGALVNRLIPTDALSAGGTDVGIDIYIDRQLAGDFGKAEGLYMVAPFAEGFPGQGPQSALTPAARYRKTLSALADYCHSAYLGKGVSELPAAEQDKLLTGMADGSLQLTGVSSKAFFSLLLQNAKEGFFADPIYGGNKDMVGWKMIGFPGARYDYRDWIEQHNKPYPKPPIGLASHPDWATPA